MATVLGAENSEVLPEGLEKKRTTNVLLGVLLSLPRTAVEVAEVLAEVRTGLFCKSLGPA